MENENPLNGSIAINLAEMREVVDLAIRRVSAFVRFGLDGIEARDGGDFNLSASLVYCFWPSEIGTEHRNAARDEFKSWLIGSCLRELDLFYGLFLDKVWFAIEVAELHGTRVRSDYRFDSKFSKDTNVANKQKKVANKLGLATHLEELNSLSLARNTLAHNAGVVRAPVDCNDPERTALILKWLAFDMLVSSSGYEQVVDEAPFDTHTLPGEGEIQVAVRFTNRAVKFESGMPIILSNPLIAELCMFYKIISDQTIEALTLLLTSRGILTRAAMQSEALTDG